MAKIVGLGSWVPATIRKNSDWDEATVKSWEKHNQRALADATKVDETAVLDKWTTQGFQAEVGDPFVGTVERRVVSDEKAWDAETAAALEAIQQAKIDPQLIGAVLSYSFVPDMACGNGAAMVMNNLGLNNAYAIGVDSMCSAAVSHLALAKALINAEEAEYVLLTQSNFMTRGIPMGHPSSPSIGDAATAILVGPDYKEGHTILSVYSRTVRDQYDAVVWRRKEDNQDWWTSGGSYYLGSFNPKKAKELVQQTLPIAVDTTKCALQQVDMSEKDLDFFVSVQPRKWIPAGIAEMMGLFADQTIETFEQYAHLGCCGPIVNLVEAVKQKKLRNNDIVGIYAQGAGFTRAAAIIEW
jgi:3-oxoacyl-[acyl-carrier-protein] synthase-3